MLLVLELRVESRVAQHAPIFSRSCGGNGLVSITGYSSVTKNVLIFKYSSV